MSSLRFKTKARAIDLLGEKQIADDITAISELFKNAHDADANNAVLSVDTKSGSLLLWDDGHGMSYYDVVDKWLTIGTDAKLGSAKHGPVLSDMGRVTMGEKGIGRLAIAILGRQMLMVTKRRGTDWTIVYLHWGIFENGKLFLEDTSVPVVTATNIAGLYQALPQLQAELIGNLTRTDRHIEEAWAEYPDLKDDIKKDIEGFQLTHQDLALYFEQMERMGHGTLFLVSNLRENWRALRATDRRGPIKRKLDNLSIMMNGFMNSIALFERGASEAMDFHPLLEIDGLAVARAEGFAPEDLERFDFRLDGTLANGTFIGTATVHGNEPEAVTVSVTQGIMVEEQHDCGPLQLRLFFVEGRHTNSFLPPSIHTEITRKLNLVGGIYLYRDGLRVLPYGSADFDFLELEKERTKNLGRALFSSRRVFGYVAITKAGNPSLQDKSSREGLRETKEYQYFITTLKNLMKWWATSFIAPRRKKTQNADGNEAEKVELQDRRQADLERFLAQINRSIQVGKSRAKAGEKNLAEEFDTQFPTPESLRSRGESLTYPVAMDLLRQLDEYRGSLPAKVSGLFVVELPPMWQRFDREARVQESWTRLNDWVSDFYGQLLNNIEGKIEERQAVVRGQLDEFLRSITEQIGGDAQQLLEDLRTEVHRAVQSVEETKRHTLRQLDESLQDQMNEYLDKTRALSDYVRTRHTELAVPLLNAVTAAFEVPRISADQLQTLFTAFSQLGTGHPVREQVTELQNQLLQVTDDLAKAQQSANHQLDQARKTFRMPLLDFKDLGELTRVVEHDWRLIHHLQRQVHSQSLELESYRHLVATGLAAEIVNHEFEQQYELLHKLFGTAAMRRLLAENQDLRAIQYLFRHLEERHRLLSPLYRQTRVKRRDISLYDIGEQMRRLFKTPIKLYDIDFRNEIESDFMVKESEAILFPTFINIINNSIYWIMNRQERTILLHSDKRTRSLFLEDSGPGIDPTKVDEIFELFYSTRPDGRGIGLHLVRQILAGSNHLISAVTAHPAKQLDGACMHVQFAKPRD